MSSELLTFFGSTEAVMIYFLYSSLRYRRGLKRPYRRRIESEWIQRLVSWRVVTRANWQTRVKGDVLYCWERIENGAAIGTEMAGMFGMALYFFLAGWVLKVPWAMTIFWVFVPLIFSCLSIGHALGYTIGILKERRQAQHGITYGGLRVRRVSDYHHPTTSVLALLFVAYFVGTALFFLLWNGWKPTPIDAGFIPLVAAPWTILVIPVAMLLLLLCAEGFTRYVVTIPRLLVTDNIEAAHRSDEMVRALVIGHLDAFLFGILGYVGLYQWIIVRSVFWHFSPVVQIGSLILPILSALFGIALALFGERHGGMVTKWPWSAADNV